MVDRKYFQSNGLKLSYLEAGSIENEPVMITHANGYAAGVYRYLIEYLSQNWHVVALDFGGHGESQSMQPFKNWDVFKKQVIDLAAHMNFEYFYGIGHSLGAAVLMRTAYSHSTKVKKIIALDPAIVPAYMVAGGRIFKNPLAHKALKRRSMFNSLEEIKKRYSRTKAFKNMNNEIFEDYLEACFKKTGEGFVLRCSIEHEARIFSTMDLKGQWMYSHLDVPVHFVLPENKSVMPLKLARKYLTGNRSSSLTLRDNLTHFFPFEEPGYTAQVCSTLLQL